MDAGHKDSGDAVFVGATLLELEVPPLWREAFPCEVVQVSEDVSFFHKKSPQYAMGVLV